MRNDSNQNVPDQQVSEAEKIVDEMMSLESASRTPVNDFKPIGPPPVKSSSGERVVVIEPTLPEDAPLPMVPVPTAVDDPQTDKVVEDIVASEGDALLEMEDEKRQPFVSEKSGGFGSRVKEFFSAWWHNGIARWATLIGIFLIIMAAGAIPGSRYFILNTIGVRSSMSLSVMDATTRQPLKNVNVSLGGVAAKTNNDGSVQLQELRLGKSELVIERRAFAPIKKPIVVGWGSNPLGNFELTAVGTQYTIMVSDFLSDKPIEKLEAVSGEASAFSDENGKIVLTLDKDDDSTEAIIQGQGYREESITLPEVSDQEVVFKAVPARKHVFISKRSGTYDVYRIDVDGKNEELVLAGTGSERDDMVLVQHPNRATVALVSTRNDKRNKDGFLLSILTLINLEDNSAKEIAESERIQLVDWVDKRLAYVRVAEGASAANPERMRLILYNLDEDTHKQVAAANYFNDVISVKGNIYFAPSTAFSSADLAGLYKVLAGEVDASKVWSREVWNAFRTEYGQLSLSVGQDWFTYNIQDDTADQLPGPPASVPNRVYVDGPEGKRSLWIEERDGKGVLLSFDVIDGKDKIIHSQSGLKHPVEWVNNDTVKFRIKSDRESADYVMSLEGGEARKIVDVSDTGGIDSWYYY